MDTNLLSIKYKKALELVADLFKHEKRNLTGLPYIIHLVGVSRIISQATDDEDLHIAALLHDVLEDIPAAIYSEDDMRADFGDKIADIVKTVSHDEPTHGKDKARTIYLGQIRSGSSEACLMGAADLLYNAQDIVYLYKSKPDEVEKFYGGERAVRRTWFWGERFSILRERLGDDNVIIKDLGPVLKQLEAIHQKIR